MSSPNILTAMETVFSARFKPGWLREDTYKAWRAFLAATFALPMDADALALYRKHTGRDDLPTEQFREAYAVVGRRGGKSAVASLIATFLAVFRDYSQVLAPGEQGVVMLLAADRRQAQVLLKYINSYFDHISMLKKMVLSRTKESLTLTNRIVIEVHTTSYRTTRGFTVVAAVADELAYWRSEESANPDTEVLKALRPAMTTIPNALLLCISSPYARRGALWTAYREHFGKSGAPVLVWQADTRSMNPTVSRRAIEAEYERDPAAAKAEYGAEFRSDVEAFLSLEVVESCVVRGRAELPPIEGVAYSAFCDPSGGSSDSFGLAIAHQESGRAVLDVVREIRPPFSPESVTIEYAELLKKYLVHSVCGDHYAGLWPREQFAKRGIQYRTSDRTRSELYLELLPALTSGQVELLDNKKLIAQLVGLERQTARSGKDSINHAPGSHDDVANAAAGSLVGVLGSHLVLGLVELQLEEAAKQNAVTAGAILQNKEAIDGCPECGHKGIVNRGGAWLCTQCAFSWKGPKPINSADPTRAAQTGMRRLREDSASRNPARGAEAMTTADDVLICEQCGGRGCIARRGPLGHCSHCGHEFVLDPSSPPGIRSRRPRDIEIPAAVNANLKKNPFSG